MEINLSGSLSGPWAHHEPGIPSMAWHPLSRLGFPVTPSQLLRSKTLLHAF